MHRDPAYAEVALRALLEHAPIEIAIFDSDLRCTHLNAPLADTLGVEAAALVGCTIVEAFPGLADSEAQIRAVLESGEPAIDVRSGGSIGGDEHRSWAVSYYPLRRDDGTVGGVIGIGMREQPA